MHHRQMPLARDAHVVALSIFFLKKRKVYMYLLSLTRTHISQTNGME
jgi:hypothetical protein